jgi:squalene monooxygenase
MSGGAAVASSTATAANTTVKAAVAAANATLAAESNNAMSVAVEYGAVAWEALHAYLPHIVALSCVFVIAVRFMRHRRLAKAKLLASRIPRDYDAVVIGASIAGPAMAMQLARQGRKVLVLEDSLERPDRIVGELIQPGGLAALRKMGLEECARSVGVPCSGYVSQFDGEWVQLPYEDGISGVSFHFGDFVMQLRKRMLAYNDDKSEPKTGGSITVVEANAMELLTEATDSIVTGVRYRMKEDKSTHDATCHLVCLCDGGYSKFRPTKKRNTPHSYFVGVILRGLTMPYETRGHVMLCRNGPVLSYRLDNNEVRILVDLPCREKVAPPPHKLRAWLQDEILPQLPDDYQRCLAVELERSKTVKNAIRSHPHYHFTPVFPKYRGIVGIGDSANQRHPLTGAGMTCALRDAYFLAEELRDVPYLGDQEKVHTRILSFLRARPDYSSVPNLLSWALHGVFRGRHELKKACFAYFKLGGECVTVPMAFLSTVNTSVALLMYHYIRVAILGAMIVFTDGGDHTFGGVVVGLANPKRWATAVKLLFDAIMIFTPLVWVEFAAFGRVVDPTK